MRLFITSYQKSGTHQIMPMFLPNIPDVVDRSWNCWIDAPERYGLNRQINQAGLVETIINLRKFKHGATKAFGHLSYTPEYANVFIATDTKVLFNIRDPRDVVVSEYGNAQRHYARKQKGSPLFNFLDKEDGTYLFQKDDPITELIILASAKWPNWIGWLKHDFVLPVRYEKLRLHTQETAEGISNWLEGKKCNSIADMVKATKPDGSNPTFRKGLVGEWKTVFEPHHKKLAKEVLSGIVEELGYEK